MADKERAEVTMVTTSDTDIHLVPFDLDMTRLKVERNAWIATTDGRIVRTSHIVSVWTPSELELAGFMEGVGSRE